jgi:hypothetical protein
MKLLVGWDLARKLYCGRAGYLEQGGWWLAGGWVAARHGMLRSAGRLGCRVRSCCGQSSRRCHRTG